ncbi:hypothetical protein AB833_12170 [Chromatiales bacterium (ex Bugula neritina AB1)]|nr:hypothetical protein AB833_12170 [Chromatiales bacterium (ex Bugula neritina AB1)]
MTTRFVHFPLHPETPAEGRTLEALFGSGAADIQEKNRHMKAMMEAEGLPYSQRTHTYNSRLAQELACWAVEQEGGEAIHDQLFRAYFVDTRNVADTNVLLDAAAGAGLDRAAAAQVIEERTYKSQVDADWDKSRQYGVTGVPTYVTAGTGVVGAQSYEVLEKLLTDAGAQRTA